MHQCKLEKNVGYSQLTKCWARKFCGALQNSILVSQKSPLCAKFFRSETAIKAEKERQLNSKHFWVVHPLSKFSGAIFACLIGCTRGFSKKFVKHVKSVSSGDTSERDTFKIIFIPLAYTALSIPSQYQIARAWYQVVLLLIHLLSLFGKPIDAAFEMSIKKPLYYGHKEIRAFINCLCWLDIFMNFMTGYVVTRLRKIEMEPKQIAKNYMRSPFFICDVLSAFPRSLIYFFVGVQYRRFMGIVNLFSILKISRIITVVSLINNISQNFMFKMNKTVIFLFCSLCVTTIMIHWMACIQFIVPRIFGRLLSDTLTTDSWIHQDGLYEKSMMHKYLHAFFKTSAEILAMRLPWYTLGSTTDYVVAVVTYIVGKILMVSTWIILAITILNSRSMEIKFDEIINQLDEYMKQKQLPLNLRDRLAQYYKFKYQKKYFKEEMITGLLSAPLRKEVDINVCKSLISNVSLFTDLTPEQLSLLVAQLIPEIFLPKDTIIQSGTRSESMFFLSSGTVAVYTHSGKEICHLEDGDYFGEICLVLKSHLAQTTVVAIEFTQVYRLKKKDFDKIILKNKVVFNNIVKEAELRLKTICQYEEIYKRELFEKTFRKNEE